MRLSETVEIHAFPFERICGLDEYRTRVTCVFRMVCQSRSPEEVAVALLGACGIVAHVPGACDNLSDGVDAFGLFVLDFGVDARELRAFLYTENHPLGGWFQRAYGFTPLWKAEIL